jgi:hypothetical protein
MVWQGPLEYRVNADDLRSYDQLLGHWEIRYPERPGIERDYAEHLQLRSDGVYTWEPTPLWAKPEGRWGVAGNWEANELNLYFEERRGTFRGQCLVLTDLKVSGRTERYVHWQRTHYSAVVFADRILAGRWLGLAYWRPMIRRPYPRLVVRIFPAFYQQEAIEIRVGPPAVDVVNHRCRMQYPTPRATDGRITPECRALLIAGVQSAVRRLKLRMCILWSPASCTYVEADLVSDATAPPSGGELPGNLEFKAHCCDPEAI